MHQTDRADICFLMTSVQGTADQACHDDAWHPVASHGAAPSKHSKLQGFLDGDHVAFCGMACASAWSGTFSRECYSHYRVTSTVVSVSC